MLIQKIQEILRPFSKAPFFEVVSLAVLATLFSCQSKLWILLLFPLCLLRKHFKLYPLLLFLLFAIYVDLSQIHMPNPLTGSLTLKIKDKRAQSLFGKTMYLYKGRVLYFESDDGRVLRNIPVSFTIKKKAPISEDKDYFIEKATLEKGPGKYAKLKIDPEKKILPIKQTLGIAKLRFLQKQKAQRFIKKYVENRKVQKLLEALSIGYVDHKTLSFEFSKLGLSHLLAISGFHFAMLSFFLFLILQITPSRKIQGIFLIFLLSLYVLYLGGSSSVTRAYVGICIYLFAKIFSLRPSALNTLSATFVISYLQDPFCIIEIGFQLSYIATFAILAFYQDAENALLILIPKREPKEVLFWPFFDKLLYLGLCLIRKSFALSFCVSFATLPFLLFHFEKFPVISLFYNLFIPFLFVSLMGILFLSFCLFFAEPIAKVLFKILERYTLFLLQIIEDVPKPLEIYLYKSNVSFTLSILLFFSLFLLPLILKNKIDKTPLA